MSQLLEFGAAYIIIMAAVILSAVLDAVSIYRCLTSHREDLTDYAEFMIKYTKIFMMFLFGAYFIIQTFDERLTFAVKAVHIAVGLIAAADGIAGLIVKHKFKYKK